MDDDGGSDEATIRDDDEQQTLNYASATFDPLRALYAASLPPQSSPAPPSEVADRRLFNNVAEFESFLKNPERMRDKNTADSWAAPTSAVVGGSCSATSADPPAAAPPKAAVRSIRRVKNVLTRMENMEGPLSMLRKYVNERLRVSVVTRNYRCVRGVCKGYVVAFDKHWNLAMIDVDEEFQNPLYDVERRDEASAVSQIKKNQRRKRKKVALAVADAGTRTVSTFLPPGDPITDDGCASDADAAASASSVFRETDVLRLSESARQEAAAPEENDVAAISRSLAGFVLREPKLSMPKTLHRHVNQLFIRGNNVVSVSFAGP